MGEIYELVNSHYLYLLICLAFPTSNYTFYVSISSILQAHSLSSLAHTLTYSLLTPWYRDLKRAIACLLFGGSRKVLADGVKLRGDINVLLMGDPSTAKSQFLKFVEKVSPIGVYTSGKGSSAAGLTASIIKDAKGEFFLEGGAMVLADGGVICIDEVCL